MDWTLPKIRAKVRALTGRPSATGQLTDGALDDFINNYYQESLPYEIGLDAFRDTLSLIFADGDTEKAVDPDTYIKLEPPYLIDDATNQKYKFAANFYVDAKRFFDLYPEPVTGESYSKQTPVSALYWHQAIHLRPVPNGDFTFSCDCIKKPDALTEIDDQPAENAWGPLIAYSAAIDILVDNEQDSEAQVLIPMRKHYLGLAQGKQVAKFSQSRPMPRF